MSETATVQSKVRYIANAENFTKIPGSPIAYWVSEKFFLLYNKNSLDKEISFKRGIATGDNDKFLRLWYEVANNKCSIEFDSKDKKWFPYNKGGDFRKWYGNREYVINWENEGSEIRCFKKNGKLASRPQNIEFNFAENISYSSLTSSTLSFRVYRGFINDQAGNFFIRIGMSSFQYLISLLNSIVSSFCLKMRNPTLNTTAEDFIAIPFLYESSKNIIVEQLANSNINISKSDWDSYETSWDFKKHPLI